MKNRILLIFCMLVLALSGSAQNDSNGEWVSIGLKRHITHPQPMTGMNLWPYKAKKLHDTYGQSIQLEFYYFEPCKIVKGCNADGSIIYDWTYFEQIISDVASRGHQLVARFRYEYPNSTSVDGNVGTTAVPDYIKQLPDYEETYSESKGTYYADWSNAELQRFTLLFYTDFAKRYAHDPRLAFLEVGFGHWSEYHIHPTPMEYGKNFPSLEYQKEFLLRMSEVSDGLPWLVSKNAGDTSPIAGDDELLSLRFGLFEDSFMGGNAAPDGQYGTPERIREVSMLMGYRFVVKECLTDGHTTRLLVSNEGIAPIYRDAFFAIGGVRSATSLKGLLPSEDVWMEIAAAPASDGADINIVSDHILPQQEIEFEADIHVASHITPVAVSDSKTEAVYNIAGQQLTEPTGGICIVGGKKVVR